MGLLRVAGHVASGLAGLRVTSLLKLVLGLRLSWASTGSVLPALAVVEAFHVKRSQFHPGGHVCTALGRILLLA
jgi:hypothetical protein